MKQLKLSLALMIVILCVASINSYAAISGSSHDFSGQAWNTSGEICLPCHTPHGGNQTVAPLWNHTSTVATFTLYTSTSLDATMGQPSGVSKACLSCHDGTVALDSYGGATGTNMIASAGNLGTDLSNDHPVSFTYDASLSTTDGELYDPTTKTVTQLSGGTVQNKMLFSNKVECSSCHDVHNKTTAPHMLLFANTASALCLTCHNK